MDGLKTAAQLMANKKEHLVDTGVDVLKHLSDQYANHTAQEQEHLHQTLQQAGQQVAQQTKPTKGE